MTCLSLFCFSVLCLRSHDKNWPQLDCKYASLLLFCEVLLFLTVITCEDKHLCMATGSLQVLDYRGSFWSLGMLKFSALLFVFELFQLCAIHRKQDKKYSLTQSEYR